MVLVLQGDNAVKKNRELMGATDPAKADNGTIRAAHGANIEFNAVHGSDAPETAKFEIGYFSPKWSWSGRRTLSADFFDLFDARRPMTGRRAVLSWFLCVPPRGCSKRMHRLTHCACRFIH